MWELDYKESWAPKNWCFWTVVLEKTLERVPWTARRSNQSILKEIILNIHWKDWCWSWNSNTLATWCEDLTHLKRPWCWERLKAGEGDDRGWDGCMASLTRWTWVWARFGSWWWTGKPGVLQSMGSQSQTWLSDWIELISQDKRFFCSWHFDLPFWASGSQCNIPPPQAHEKGSGGTWACQGSWDGGLCLCL